MKWVAAVPGLGGAAATTRINPGDQAAGGGSAAQWCYHFITTQSRGSFGTVAY